MEKFGNDTFKYNGKLYKVVKKEKGHRCSDTCPLCNELDGGCGEICSAMYNQLKNPEFTFEDVVLVEVAPGEASIKNDEIDWEKLYKEEHDRYEEMCKAEQMRLDQLASWYGSLPDGDEKQFEKLEEIFPELAEDKDEKIRKEIYENIRINNPKEFADKYIAWLEKHKEQKPVEQKATWSKEDEETLNSAISFVEHSAFTSIGKGRNYVISWLKSLKDRVAWRPTEEQMKALGDAIFDAEYDHRLTEMGALLSLDKDLKKL